MVWASRFDRVVHVAFRSLVILLFLLEADLRIDQITILLAASTLCASKLRLNAVVFPRILFWNFLRANVHSQSHLLVTRSRTIIADFSIVVHTFGSSSSSITH